VVTKPPPDLEVDHVAPRKRESLLARMSIFPTPLTPHHHTTNNPLSREKLMTDVANHAPAHLGNAPAPTAPTRIRRRLRARRLPLQLEE
jgi:hypothetical protein